jgi:hypothetical protein
MKSLRSYMCRCGRYCGDIFDLRDLADQALEGQLADQQLRGLLVLADLAQRDGAGPVAVGLLHATCARIRPLSAPHPASV